MTNISTFYYVFGFFILLMIILVSFRSMRSSTKEGFQAKCNENCDCCEGSVCCKRLFPNKNVKNKGFYNFFS